MKSTFRKRDNLKTPFVQINSCKCIGCWECINICPNNVIDKSFLFIANTLINEQVLIYNARKCTGCFKCLHACTNDAISIYMPLDTKSKCKIVEL